MGHMKWREEMKKLVYLMLVAAMLLAACGPRGEETPAAGEGEGATAAPAATLPATEQAPEATAEETTAGAGQPTAVEERTTVRFAVTDWQLPIYQDMLKAFEEENPDLRVEVVSMNEVLELGPIGQIEIPDDADERLAAAADVASIGVTRENVQQGLLRDLTPFIDADPNFQAGDFFLDALEVYQWDGGTWALPTTLNLRLFFYDKDAFDAAGVEYPQIGWSWDDLLVKAKALTESEGDEVTRWGFVPNDMAYRLIESRVGKLVDDSTEPFTPRFEEPEVVEAVRWYADLYRTKQVMPYFEPTEEQGALSLSDEQALIDKGQAVIWPDTDIVWWLRQQQGNFGVVPFPADTPDAPGSPAFPASLAISAGTQQPEAAWRLLEFLSRQTLSGLTMGMRFLPARRSAAETGDFWDDMDGELETALRAALDHGYVVGPALGYDALDEALYAILSGEQAVEDALQEAQTRAEAEFQEQMLEQAGVTPVPTFVVGGEEEEPVAEGAVSISFVPGLGSLNLEPYRDLADRFHEANPGVVVKVEMADFVTGTPNLKSMAEGSDCFIWFPGFQDPENRGAILGLKPFVDADAAFSTTDFPPSVLKQFTYQGQLMGLPADITPFVLEYNKDLLDAAGEEYPAADWTWDDFLALAVATTEGEGEGKQYGFVAEAYELNDLVLITERLGARLIDEDADPPAVSFGDPATVEAVRWYAELVTEHGVKPVFITSLGSLLGASSAVVEREAMINDGRATMWTSSPATAAIYGERGINAGVASPPARADGTTASSYLAVSGYFISAQTENPLACWQWITYLSEQPSAVQGLPARRSVAESDAYRQQVGAERADAYLASMGDSEQPSAFQVFSEEEWLGGSIFWYGEAFGQIVEGEASVEDALAAAQKLADDYRACVVAGGDFTEKAWQACAKEVDPNLPDFLFAASE